MNAAQKILFFMGLFFMGIGLTIGLMFGIIFRSFVIAIIPGFFVVLGACFTGGVLYVRKKEKDIVRKGTKYAAKIYGYVKDTSIAVNGSFPVNIKVRYFDRMRNEKEAIIPTGFPEGSPNYAIGMTIDIFEYQGKYGFDPNSVRNEEIPFEAELMDEVPIEPERKKMTSVHCPSCGSSYKAVRGYTGKCPYCGSFTNAD